MALALPNSKAVTERSPLLNKTAHWPAGCDNDHDDLLGGRRDGEDEDDDQTTEEKDPTIPQLLRIMSGVYVGAFLASLDATLIATLATPISSSFDSPTLFSWLVSAYFIANAISKRGS
ncbi:hypothetical protein MMC17_006552 [Xylographa soralifera]|nr:hypothetical protein [Xylographa soralifera]